MKNAVLKKGAALLLILAMAFAALGLSPRVMAQGTTDWPAFRKDAANNGIVDVKTGEDGEKR